MLYTGMAFWPRYCCFCSCCCCSSADHMIGIHCSACAVFNSRDCARGDIYTYARSHNCTQTYIQHARSHKCTQTHTTHAVTSVHAVVALRYPCYVFCPSHMDIDVGVGVVWVTFTILPSCHHVDAVHSFVQRRPSFLLAADEAGRPVGRGHSRGVGVGCRTAGAAHGRSAQRH
jgi:hypothetical protein